MPPPKAAGFVFRLQSMIYEALWKNNHDRKIPALQKRLTAGVQAKHKVWACYYNMGPCHPSSLHPMHNNISLFRDPFAFMKQWEMARQ